MVQITFTPTADIIGIIGVGLTLLAYFLLHMNRLSSNSKSYALLNLIGAIMVMYSLLFDWNTPAVIMEGAWIVISLYGTVKAYCFPSYEL